MRNSLFLAHIILILFTWQKVCADNTEIGIVHGVVVTPHSLPYVVALQTTINDTFRQCGGSLIRNNTVLTAAWCVNGANETDVILGAHNITDEDENTQIRLKSSNFTIHERYDPESHWNDIAVVYLSEDVILTDAIQLIQTPTEENYNETYSEQLGMVAGWGRFNDNNRNYSDVLRKMEATIIPYIDCALPYLFKVYFQQICTTGVQNRQNICLGDSGSPLVVEAKRVQVGIASYGSDYGCSAGLPGVHTRLTSYYDWLQSV